MSRERKPEPLFRASTLGHGWTVAAVVAICGGVFAMAYGAVQSGLAEPVSTFTTAFLITLGRLTLGGRVSGARQFAATSRVVTAFMADFERWKTESPLIRKSLIAIGYGLGFLVLKYLVTWTFEAVANPWIAIGVGCLVGSVILSPVLWAHIKNSVVKL